MIKLLPLVKGIDLTAEEVYKCKEEPCEVCIQTKATRLPFGASEHKTNTPLELLHMDLCGPIKPASRYGDRYFLVILDDYTGYSLCQPLSAKAVAGDAIKKSIKMLETQTGLTVKAIRSDSGGELSTQSWPPTWPTRASCTRRPCPTHRSRMARQSGSTARC